MVQKRKGEGLVESIEAFRRLEGVEDHAKAWRPWQRKQFEIFQGIDISTPTRRHFFQGYLLVSIQSGVADNQYRNARSSDRGGEGMFRVFEPEETWICRPQNSTFQGLVVDPDWLQRFAIEMLQREKPLPHFPSYCLCDPSLSSALRDIADRSQTPVSRLQQEEMFLQLFAPLLFVYAEETEMFPHFGWEHPAIKRAKEYLQAHYVEEVSLQDLSRVTYLSPFHLARVFRQSVGVPPHAYQTQLRLAYARRLLAQGWDVGYVAHETGFFDQSHFAQQFQRYFFVKPGVYRKTARFSS